jgi:hypothetical protein
MAILLLREVLLATRTEHEKGKPLYSLPRIAAVTTLRQPLLRFANWRKLRGRIWRCIFKIQS